ncbi:MAG: cold-shock protein, partial [Mycobacterium sp.]
MGCRRPAPSLLFTAVAATVLLLPLAVDGAVGDRVDAPRAEDTQLAQHPLPDAGAGETIREVSQPTPFSLVALTGTSSGTTARVRAKRSDGGWGPWYDVEADEYLGPDNSGPPRGTEPVFVGRTTTVQIAINRPAPAAPPAAPTGRRPELGYKPANVEQPIGQNVNAILITPPQAPSDQFAIPTAVTPPGQPPAIISRAQWGADESMRCGPTTYDKGIRAAVIHHTAGSNDYSPQDSAEIIRAIYAYHTRTLGWCDIAYNALVDKYGQVFEG